MFSITYMFSFLFPNLAFLSGGCIQNTPSCSHTPFMGVMYCTCFEYCPGVKAQHTIFKLKLGTPYFVKNLGSGIWNSSRTFKYWLLRQNNETKISLSNLGHQCIYVLVGILYINNDDQ